MSDMIKAVYKATGDKCWLNMDYVVDVFLYGSEVLAYTLDDQRSGYRIEKDTFEKWMEEVES